MKKYAQTADTCIDCGKPFGKTTTGRTKNHERDYFKGTTRNADFTPLDRPTGGYGCGYKTKFTKQPTAEYAIVRANNRLQKKKQNELRGKAIDWNNLWYDYPQLKSLFYFNFAKFRQYAIERGYISSDQVRMKKQINDLIRARRADLEWA